MIRTAFYAVTYWAPALVILLLVLARVAAPFPYVGPDYNQTIQASLIAAAKERADRGTVYVKVDGADPSAEILADLTNSKLPATFTPWSLRPHAICPPKTVCGGVVDGQSMLDNSMSADLLSIPLWGLASVRVKAGRCVAEFTLLRAIEWRVVSQRTACS
jgi:hypothetical protein